MYVYLGMKKKKPKPIKITYLKQIQLNAIQYKTKQQTAYAKQSSNVLAGALFSVTMDNGNVHMIHKSQKEQKITREQQ